MKVKILVLGILFFVGCTKVTPRRPIAPKPSTTIFKETIKENKLLNKVEDDKILNLITKDSTKTYFPTSNGFWYTYITKVEENLPSPKKGDEVTFTYNITDLKDSIIYSKQEIGVKNYKVDKEDLISGLQKGIKLMKIGETLTFVIPSYSAFGITGDGSKIGLNQSIKSTVTLINIK
jgi:gliding motility-associated peptidyl-prolyl isomerase